MSNWQNWATYIEQLMRQMNEQQQQIKQLSTQLESLKDSQQPKTVIEKIEYHFDQLKIESLEGTLHIGLSPQDLEQMDDFSYPGSPIKAEEPAPLHVRMDRDFVENGDSVIQELAQTTGAAPTHAIKEQILADIRKQLPGRIQHYQETRPDLSETDIEHFVGEEVRHSIQQYLATHKGDDSNGIHRP
ncbi:spore germination protein GerPC [Thalassobacillus sp. CUG 92003]|uniref:spore germination protein GerPC n=1 Tax=Thalassobacillus sp. CUG 92003 TaxID=2736641 RepID=UPI0015E64F93|nr:spore germination protein GerPC [Thalassobacillus sp. CUG 92003]